MRAFPALSEFFMRIYESGVLVVLPVLLILFFIFLTVSHLFGLSVSHNTGNHCSALSAGWSLAPQPGQTQLHLDIG